MQVDAQDPLWSTRLAYLGAALIVASGLLLRARGRLLAAAGQRSIDLILDGLFTPLAAVLCGLAMPLLRTYGDFNGLHVDALAALIVLAAGQLYIAVAFARCRLSMPLLRLVVEAAIAWPAFFLAWMLSIRNFWDDLAISATAGSVLGAGFVALAFAAVRWLDTRARHHRAAAGPSGPAG
jgi:hypothetical protein